MAVNRVRWAPAAALLVGAAEIMAFVGLSQLIGIWLTLLLVVAVSLLGGVLLRREGLRAWRGFRQAAAGGAPPGPRVADGLVGLGGALLLTAPGLLTSLAGAALLTPPVRALARSRIQVRAERQMSSAQAGEVFGPRRVRVQREQPTAADQDGHDEVVEGEIVDEQ